MSPADGSRVVIKSNISKIAAGFSPPQMTKLKTSIGIRLQTAFKERIKEGDASWAPLSAAWAEKKGHSNQWYFTGRLEKAIEYKVDDAGVRVGVLKHETYPDSGENVALVALKLEYGGSNLPARPLFRPVFEEQVKGIVKDATADIQKRIKKAAI